MNDKIVANELKRIAKAIKADFGDVPMFLNVSDYFLKSNGAKMDSNDVKNAMDILSNATIDVDIKKHMKDVLNRYHLEEIQEAKLKVK